MHAALCLDLGCCGMLSEITNVWLSKIMSPDIIIRLLSDGTEHILSSQKWKMTFVPIAGCASM